jgi:hypothetical protein
MTSGGGARGVGIIGILFSVSAGDGEFTGAIVCSIVKEIVPVGLSTFDVDAQATNTKMNRKGTLKILLILIPWREPPNDMLRVASQKGTAAFWWLNSL